MPLYEYQCQSCHHSFEELVFGDEKVNCPACHASKLARLISVPARPQSDTGGSALPTACRSEGPPCGPRCARFPD
jgi:putative FmdB family regulatory protein